MVCSAKVCAAKLWDSEIIAELVGQSENTKNRMTAKVKLLSLGNRFKVFHITFSSQSLHVLI